MIDPWSVALLLSKAALYIGALTSAGLILNALLLPIPRHRGLVSSMAALGMLAALMGMAIQAAMLTGSAAGLTDPTMLGLLWSTPVGTALAFQVCGLLWICAAVFFGKTGLWVALPGVALTLWSFTQIGHVAALDTPLLAPALLLHLAAGAFWIGVLLPLHRLAAPDSEHTETGAVGHRFGQVAMFVIPLLIALGAVLAYALTGSLSNLFLTSYGQTLLTKIALVAGLLTLGAINKTRLVPRLREGDATALTDLRRTLRLEIFAMLAILFITAYLTTSVSLPK